jgi:hypothetical protein
MFISPSQVPQEGLEPPWAIAHYALNVARLPIPPLRRCINCEGNYIMPTSGCQIIRASRQVERRILV